MGCCPQDSTNKAVAKGVPMSGETKFFIGIIIATTVIIGGALVLMGNQKPAPKREDQGSASLMIDKKSEDFGTMKVSDERTAKFTITNTAQSVLRIWNVNTSCDCTFARLTIGAVESPEFNMAGMQSVDKANWLGEVPAGKSAVLTVTYKPSVMPVKGPITRQVNFYTNDPKNPEMQVSVAADVQ